MASILKLKQNKSPIPAVEKPIMWASGSGGMLELALISYENHVFSSVSNTMFRDIKLVS